MKLDNNFIYNSIKNGQSVSHFSRSVMSSSLRPHGLQHARPPCPSPTPKAYSNSSPLSWWCHPTISSSAISFSFLLQSFPAWGSFQMSQFFTSGGQSIRVSASASALPVNIPDWFPLGWTGLLSLLSKGLSSLLQHHSLKASKVLGKLTFSSSTIMPTQKRSCFLLKTYTVWFWRNLSACILEWHWLSVGIY